MTIFLIVSPPDIAGDFSSVRGPPLTGLDHADNNDDKTRPRKPFRWPAGGR
jgi:hypothetical protein